MSTNGFCVRNAETLCLGISTNMHVEIVAIKMVNTYYLNQNFNEVQIQTGSLGVSHMINKDWKIPWEYIEYIQRTKEIIRAEIFHVYSTCP